MVLILGLDIPSWVFWVTGIVGAFLIYLFILNDEMKAGVKVFVKKFGVWIVLIGAWYFLRDYLGFFTPDNFFGRKANTYFLLLGILYLLGLNFIARERYISTQAVADNRSGSCARYKQIGEWIILNIGSCDADAFPWHDGHETWVVPAIHFNKINKKQNASATQIVVQTNIQKADLLEVPSTCFDFIQSTGGYNKDNVYFGIFSADELESEMKLKDETGKEFDLTIWESKLKDTNRMLNENREMLKGKTSQIKRFVSDVSTIQKKASGRSSFNVYPQNQSNQQENM